jgi:hypothetical protein
MCLLEDEIDHLSDLIGRHGCCCFSCFGFGQRVGDDRMNVLLLLVETEEEESTQYCSVRSAVRSALLGKVGEYNTSK